MTTTTMGQMMLMAAGHDLLRASEEQASRHVSQGPRWAPAPEAVRPKKSFKDMTGEEYALYLDQAMKGTAV